MAKLKGKIALITDGSSGIGLATAKQFVNEGAHVFVTGASDSELAAAVEKVGANVTSVRADVSNIDDLDRMYAEIKKRRAYSMLCSRVLPLRRMSLWASLPRRVIASTPKSI